MFILTPEVTALGLMGCSFTLLKKIPRGTGILATASCLAFTLATGARPISTLWFFVLGSALPVLSRGQAIDTVLFRESPGTQRFTIIDQVADPQERRAFLKLYAAHEPQKRRKLAEEFIATYPQSWLLAQTYEIAARACIDLDDYAPALRFGSQSLRLFPENPLLLVPRACRGSVARRRPR